VLTVPGPKLAGHFQLKYFRIRQWASVPEPPFTQSLFDSLKVADIMLKGNKTINQATVFIVFFFFF